MTHKPAHWKPETTLRSYAELEGEPISSCMGWTFWEHPVYGDEHPILAVSLDYIGDLGPIVFNTGDFDVPEYF